MSRLRRSGDDVWTLAGSMFSGAIGPGLSFVSLFVLPIIGFRLLPADEFAMWVVLASISTISLSMDFGGTSLAMARFEFSERASLLLKASLLSALGSVVVGLLAWAVWLPYSQTEAAAAFGFGEGLGAIACTSAGSIVRGSLMVVAQAALVERKIALRNYLLAGQAFLGVAITLYIAAQFQSAWALPIGWLSSGVIVMSTGLFWVAKIGMLSVPPRPSDHLHTSILKFAWARTLATVLGATILQCDRWVVGAIGGAAMLASYEVAWRVAALPRYLLQNLSAVLGSDAARRLGDHVSGSESPKGFLRRSMALSATAAAGSCAVMGLLYPVVVNFANANRLDIVFVLLLFAFTVHGMTAPLSVIGIGMDMPAIDLPYLLCSGAIATLAIVVALLTRMSELYIVLNCFALTAGCAFFFLYGPRRIYAAAKLRAVAQTARSR